MNNLVKSYYVGSILNIGDLVTSFMGFQVGYIETNMWYLVFSNSYIAALMGVMTFQLILSGFLLITWFLSRKYPTVWVGLLTLGLTKVYPIIHNIILILARL